MSEDLDAITECPSCGSEVWDNRAKNAERRARGEKQMPDLSCKAKCGWVKWPPKEKKAPAPKIADRPHYTLQQLGALYEQCFAKAANVVAKNLGADVSSESVVSAAATLMIQACKEGIRPVGSDPV